MAAELVNAVGEGINNALALTGSPPQLKIPASGSSADTNEVSVVGSPDKVVDLNAVGDGFADSLRSLNPLSTDQGNKQVGADGQDSGSQTPLGRASTVCYGQTMAGRNYFFLFEPGTALCAGLALVFGSALLGPRGSFFLSSAMSP